MFLFLSLSPGPARTDRTSICKRRLSSPNPLPAERTHVPVSQRWTAFPWLWSSGKGWFSDSSSSCSRFLTLTPRRLLHAIVIAVEHPRILNQPNLRGCSGATQRPGPTVCHKMSSRHASCSMSISRQWKFPDFQPAFLLKVYPNRPIKKKMYRLV